YKLIDSHCHIFSEEFDGDRFIILKRAYEKGIIGIVESALDVKTALKTLHEIESPTTNVKIYLSVGLNPSSLDATYFKENYKFIEDNIQRLTAIGEIGLDFYQVENQYDREKQRSYFKSFISLANEHKLPIIVHSRSAGKYALEVLVESRAEKVLLHAFDGSFKSAKLGVENGFFFSIPPSVAYSLQKRKLVKKLPLEQILLETDSPALSPVKGVRNTLENLVVSLNEIAKLKSTDVKELAEVTFKNTVKLFNIRNL
ncbi:MAG: TatD family hydrolase, partial [Candidatus Odinarchaeota archaeon]